MDDTKATEHLLRRMNGVTGDRDPPEILGTELRLGESQFTLKTILKVLGISGRHVRRLYRGKVSFEKTRKIQLEDKSEDEEPEHEIMDEIEDVQDCEYEEESVSRRIVIVETLGTGGRRTTAKGGEGTSGTGGEGISGTGSKRTTGTGGERTTRT
jgi:hypothetical protein